MKQSEISIKEFVALMATLMALTALSIDAFLPALTEIGKDLNILKNEDYQLIISTLFLGSAIGQIFYGPVADNIGRKPSIYIGMIIFLVGSLFSIFSQSLTIMLFGRVIQGIGLAGPRIVCTALVRDRFKGDQMAKAMSYILTVLIIVPILAPTLGQLILNFSNWRTIFTVILIYAIVALIWFIYRQAETLKPENKIPFSFSKILETVIIVFKTKVTLGYSIAVGFVSGAFLGFLNSAHDIFQIQYKLGEAFPLYFAGIALSVGLASLTNSRLVLKYGMFRISSTSSLFLSCLSIMVLVLVLLFKVPLTLFFLMIYMVLGLFGVGFLFSNLTSMAMEPLGKVAGIGSGIVGSVMTFISLPIGITIGKLYNGTAIPMIASFAIFGGLAYLLIIYTNRRV